MDEVEMKIKDIICRYVKSDNITLDTKFELLGLGSINFVKFIIDIEKCFDIEVEEEMLLVSELSDIRHVAEYVSSIVNGKQNVD